MLQCTVTPFFFLSTTQQDTPLRVVVTVLQATVKEVVVVVLVSLLSATALMPRVLVIGFGSVGRKLLQILTQKRECLSPWGGIPALTKLARQISIVGITTRSRGSLINQTDGVDLDGALAHFGPQNPDHSSIITSEEAVEKLEYDILVELSTLEIKTKGFPAIAYVENALQKGSHVVSANKGPVAFEAKRLLKLAERQNRLFLSESAVMDGAPIFGLQRSALKGAQSFHEAVSIAQQIGIAEANPSNDLSGLDSACKIAALANLFLPLEAGSLDPLAIPRDILTMETLNHHLKAEGNNSIQAVAQGRGSDIAGVGRGGAVRLVSRAAVTETGEIEASVELKAVGRGTVFDSLKGTGAALSIYTDLMTPITIVQDAPTLSDTAFGVLEDMLTIMDVMAKDNVDSALQDLDA
eukprot:jgi/Bigna1/76848/fgenesh1_pg.44_\